jgi:predicted DNA-binding protein
MNKPGRPATGSTTKNVNISLPLEIVQRLNELAKSENRKRANMASTLIMEAIERRGEK